MTEENEGGQSTQPEGQASQTLMDDGVSPDEARDALARMLAEAEKIGNRPLVSTGQLGSTRRITTSLPDDPIGRRLAYRCLTNQDAAIRTMIGDELHIVHWLCHEIERLDPKTGEIKRWVRTVLVTEDGKRISSGSDGVAKGIDSLQRFFGPAPWSPPLHVCVMSIPVQLGNYYIFDPL